MLSKAKTLGVRIRTACLDEPGHRALNLDGGQSGQRESLPKAGIR
jgi:hypothetical protein